MSRKSSGRELVDRGDPLNARVVDEYVTVEAQALQRRGVGEVGDPGPATDLVGHLLGRVAVAIGDHDRVAVRRGPAGDGRPDAAGSSGDQD